MNGLIFLNTLDLGATIQFYHKVGMSHWLSQPDIEILKHGNLLVGFHQGDKVSKDLVLTFFYDTKEEVDSMYKKLRDVATSKPGINSKYNIYNFFAKDPEGRIIEFQKFLHDLPSLC